MSRKSWLNYGLAAAVIILAIGAVIAFWYISTLPQHISNHETLVLGQDTFSPGSTAAMRVLVNDSADGKPLADAEVSLSLRPIDNSGPAVQLFSGRSDADGVVNVSFTVPADAAVNQTLIVETHSSLGTDRIEREVTVQRDYRVLLTTDKPLYQPGQVIHIRALALSTFDLQAAAAQNLTLEVADGKGNKVFRRTWLPANTARPGQIFNWRRRSIVGIIRSAPPWAMPPRKRPSQWSTTCCPSST